MLETTAGQLSTRTLGQAQPPSPRPFAPPMRDYHLIESSEDLASDEEMDYEDEADLSAHKAEKILGLTPGTLSHARACLENARDEIRRLSDERPGSSFTSLPEQAGGGAGKEKMSRAKKTMSVLGLSSVGGNKVPGVVLGAGGKEEEMRREKRRRAADGVLYWQKEVGRLQAEETAAAMAASMTVRTMKKGRR